MGKRHRRTFTAQFKAEVVLEWLSGRSTQAELCRKHQLAPTLLASWRATFLERADRIFDSGQERSDEQARIAELEQLAGRQALEIEILKKASKLLVEARPNSGRLS